MKGVYTSSIHNVSCKSLVIINKQDMNGKFVDFISSIIRRIVRICPDIGI